MQPVPIQVDLFGGPSHIPGFHVVTAHSRVRADGSEEFVGEHLRTNRGRSAKPTGPRPPVEVADGQIALFPGPPVVVR